MRNLLSLLLLMSAPAIALEPDDRVGFAPASQMVGEVKRLDRGKLYFETDATDTIPIEWENVTELVSEQQLQIEVTSGRRYLGRLVGSKPEHLTVLTQGGRQTLPISDVIEITPIEEAFLERWDVDLSAGYSFAKASDVSRINLGLETAYTTEKRRSSLATELTTTNDSENNEVSRWTLDLGSRRLRENRWFNGYFGKLEQNDGLGIDLRSSLGVGGGRYLWQTNSLSLGVLAGVLASREEIDGSSKTGTTFETMFAAEFELFRFDAPEVDVLTTLEVMPSLSDFGRVRIEYDLKVRWEIIEDFFWEIKFYDSFDSDPPSIDADKNDYGIQTGILWELQ